MDLAARYSLLLPTRVHEHQGLLAEKSCSELELQAHWFAGDFGRDFTSTTGQQIRIVQFGVWNHEAGPDFSQAAVSIDGGPALSGPLEFDPDARDWERHGHASNPAYEEVVLHVFTRHEGPQFFTRTLGHRNVPQVLLDLGTLRGPVPVELPVARQGRCCAPLCALPEEQVRRILRGAADHRLQRKAAALGRLTEAHGEDEALYQALATVLGYKSNKLPFLLLSQRLPLRFLQQQRGATDSLLFGLSGFLPGDDLSQFPPETRDYLRGLWEQWWQRRADFQRLVLAPGEWSLGGRPANHPQRRLAALGQIVRNWSHVRRLAQTGTPRAVAEFFGDLHDPYWDFHYTVASKKAARPMALVGASRVVELLVNVFYPFWSLRRDSGILEGYGVLKTLLSNRRAEIAAIRLLGGNELSRQLLKSAAMQQGFLQVYEDFCLPDATDCAQCPFPTQLGQW